MSINVLRRIAIIGAILTVLVGIDGLFMTIAKYHPSDVNNYNLSDGVTVLIAAFLLLVVTVVAFVLSRRSQPTVAVAAEEASTEVTGTEVTGQDA